MFRIFSAFLHPSPKRTGDERLKRSLGKEDQWLTIGMVGARRVALALLAAAAAVVAVVLWAIKDEDWL